MLRFVPNFASIAVPLNCRLLKNQSHVFRALFDKDLDTLHTLQEELTSPPVLDLSPWEGTYTVDIDAGSHQVANTLLQEQIKGQDKPIGYRSSSLEYMERAKVTPVL